MISTNIYHINSIKQDANEGKFTMQGLALTNLIHNIIREYGKYDGVNYTVDVHNLDHADQKLVVSHFEAPEWYEWACEQPHRINSIFKEHAKYFQTLVDDECSEVYREDMEEIGMVSGRRYK